MQGAARHLILRKHCLARGLQGRDTLHFYWEKLLHPSSLCYITPTSQTYTPCPQMAGVTALLRYHAVKFESTRLGCATDHQTIWSQKEYFRSTLFISARGTAFPTTKISLTKNSSRLLVLQIKNIFHVSKFI